MDGPSEDEKPKSLDDLPTFTDQDLSFLESFTRSYSAPPIRLQSIGVSPAAFKTSGSRLARQLSQEDRDSGTMGPSEWRSVAAANRSALLEVLDAQNRMSESLIGELWRRCQGLEAQLEQQQRLSRSLEQENASLKKQLREKEAREEDRRPVVSSECLKVVESIRRMRDTRVSPHENEGHRKMIGQLAEAMGVDGGGGLEDWWKALQLPDGVVSVAGVHMLQWAASSRCGGQCRELMRRGKQVEFPWGQAGVLVGQLLCTALLPKDGSTLTGREPLVKLLQQSMQALEECFTHCLMRAARTHTAGVHWHQSVYAACDAMLETCKRPDVTLQMIEEEMSKDDGDL